MMRRVGGNKRGWKGGDTTDVCLRMVASLRVYLGEGRDGWEGPWICSVPAAICCYVAWLSFLPSLDFLLSRYIHMHVCLSACLFVSVCLRVSICLLSVCPSGSLSVSFCLSVSV